MESLTASLAFLPLLLAQEPAPVPQGGTVAAANAGATLMQHHRVFPEDTLVAFGINPVESHLPELRRTGLQDLFDAMPVPGGGEAFFEQSFGMLEEATGMPRAQLEQLAMSGLSLALTDIEGPQDVHWMAAIDLGAQSTALDAMAGMFATNTSADGIRMRPMGDNQLVAWKIVGTVLIAGSHTGDVAAGASRLETGRGISLADNGIYRQVQIDLLERDATQPLVAGFVNFSRFVDNLLDFAPGSERAKAEAFVDALQLRSLTGFGYSGLPGGGQMRDHLHLSFPGGPRGLFAALMPEVEAMGSGWSAFVPADVQTFAITHVAFDRLFDEGMGIAQALGPMYAEQARALLRGMESQTGVDLEVDLIGNLGQKVALMQWPTPETSTGAVQTPDFALLIELRSAARLDAAIRRLGVLDREAIGNFSSFRPSARAGLPPGPTPGFAVGNGLAVLTGRPERLPQMLDQIRDRNANGTIASLLDTQPDGAFGAAWTDLAATAGDYASLVDQFAQTPQFADAAAGFVEHLGRFTAHLGQARSTMRHTDTGVSFVTRSPTGSLGPVMAALLAAAASGMGEGTMPIGLGQAAAPDADSEAFRHLLTELTVATLAHREQHGGPFVDLDTLAAASSETAAILGDMREGGVWFRDGYLLQTLLPADPESRQRHFAIVAWPANEQRGEVFAVTEEGRPMANELLAYSEGLESIGRRDVFVQGTFGGDLTPGWRLLHLGQATAVRNVQSSLAEEDRLAFAAVLAAEAQGEMQVQQLEELLQSENPLVAGRAAYAAGKLRLTEAAPLLQRTATEHPDTSVRQQALASLRDMRSPEGFEPAVGALQEEDQTLRALGVSVLGRLRDGRAVDPLLTFLADPSEDSEEERSDRSLAILALTDLEAANALVQVAATVEQDTGAEIEALTYMFQTLSPKLEDREAKTLLAVLDHPSEMLRRYAIQRLGELEDPDTLAALEHRLAEEGPALQPLIEVSMTAIRGDEHLAPDDPMLARMAEWRQQAIDRWNKLEPRMQWIIGGSAGGALLVLFGIFALIRRSRRRSQLDVSDLVGASDGFYDEETVYEDEEVYAEDQGYVEYEGEEAYAEYPEDGTYEESTEYEAVEAHDESSQPPFGR